MYYLTINEAGTQELRFAQIETLPNGAMQLTKEEYDKLMNGTHLWQNGMLIINPLPSINGRNP